jgi:hypothetical protein
MKRIWSVMKGQGKLALSLLVGVLVLAVGGLSVALAASGGNNDGSERDRFAPGEFHVRAPAPALDPKLEAEMEDFRECMSDEGFDPPEPSERPDISEGPPEGLSDAFEKCEEFLPEGMPVPPPGAGPGRGDAMVCAGPPVRPDVEPPLEESGPGDSPGDQ